MKFAGLITGITSALMVFFGFFTSNAAVNKMLPIQGQWIEDGGALRGGLARSRVSIRDFRFVQSGKAATERWVFEFGDKDFKPLLGEAGYYQVELKDIPGSTDQEKQSQIVINFGQVLNSKIDPLTFKDKMKGSHLFRSVRVEFDRSNQSMNFIFDLKTKVKVRASGVADPKKPGRLFVDLVPVKAKKSNVK